jgi:hypothetical protein
MDSSLEIMRPLGPQQHYHWLEEALFLNALVANDLLI